MARARAVKPAQPPVQKMTYDEFLEWCDEDTWAAWVDGEVVILMPASTQHHRLVRFLSFVLTMFTRTFGLGEVLTAPFQMKLGPGRSGREPDLLFVAAQHLDRLLPARLDGPADLVVEIVSPESAERDRRDKYFEYEAAGVPEYWLLDPDQRRADFHRLGPDRRYHPAPVNASGVFHSEAVPGFWLRVAWLWQEPLPELEAVRELGLLRQAGPDSP